MQNSNISPQQAAQELLKRRKASQSLIAFTEYTLPSYVTAGHHHLIAEKLEEVEKGNIDRLMIFMPPRHGKSELASKRFPSWYLGRNPDKQIITASYNSDLAGDFGREVRNIVQSREYQNIFDVQLAQDSKAKDKWHTDNGGVYTSAGVGGGITGRGAHIALIDDPFKDRAEADSETVRESVWKWYTSTLYTRLMPGGAIVLIQTRWHDDDLAGRLIAAQEDGGEKWDILELKAENDGNALWPDWYPIERLNIIKTTIGKRDWNSLYQQNPIPDDGDFFKRGWFRTYDKKPEQLNIYITHDDGVTEETGDPTEIGVFGVDQYEDIYILDWWSGQTTQDVWVTVICDLIRKWKPFAVVGESGVIRRASEPYLIKQMRATRAYSMLKWLPTIGDKPARARAFQALCSMGKVLVPNAQWTEMLITELLRFPAGVLDNKVDACGLIGRAIHETWAPPPPEPEPGPMKNMHDMTLDELWNTEPKEVGKRI